MGKLYKRNGIYWMDYTVAEKRVRKSTKTSQKSLAEKMLKIEEVKALEKAHLPSLSSGKLLFSDLINEYLEYSKREKKTYRNDTYTAKRILDYFKNIKAAHVTAKQINEFLDSGENWKVSTRNRYRSFISATFNHAIKENYFTHNPCIAVKQRDESKLIRDTVLSEEEEQRLIDNSPPYLQFLIIFALETGMRKGELLKLKFSDIDIKKKRIRVRAETSKTGKERYIPMSMRLHHFVRQMEKGRASIFVYNGEPITDNFQKAFNTAKNAADLPNIRFHDLRHTFITRMVERGLPEKIIMEISGHKTRSVFDRYVNFKYDQIERYFHQKDEKSTAR